MQPVHERPFRIPKITECSGLLWEGFLSQIHVFTALHDMITVTSCEQYSHSPSGIDAVIHVEIELFLVRKRHLACLTLQL